MYGALLGMAGAGFGAYGADKTKRAMRGAAEAYDSDLAGYFAQEEALNKEYQKRYEGVSDRRLNQVGATLGEYMAPAYGQQGSDTSTIDDALKQFHAGSNPGAGSSGAAAGWGERVAADTNAATGRQRGIAGDANMLRRIGDGQSTALSNMGIADQRFGRELGDTQSIEQVRRADLAKLLQQINIRGQKNFDSASRKGSDWQTVGGLMGAGGQLIDGWQDTQARGQQPMFDTGSNVNYFRR